jgi:hypothetical protein
MQNGKERDTKTITVEGAKMEFVFNNGHNDWDSPWGDGKPKNYTIKEPGNYRVRNGKVEKA